MTEMTGVTMTGDSDRDDSDDRRVTEMTGGTGVTVAVTDDSDQK